MQRTRQTDATPALKIGQLAQATGFTTKTIRYYEEIGLMPRPRRSEAGYASAGYRLYGRADVERLAFIKRAKGLGLSLDEIRDILTLHDRHQPPCVHVLAILDHKLELLDDLIQELRQFRADLRRLRQDSLHRLDELPKDAAICGIVERGMHSRGELALAWLERQRRATRDPTAASA